MVSVVSSSSVNCLCLNSNSNTISTNKSSNFSFQLENDDMDILELGGGDLPSIDINEYSMSHFVNSSDDYKAAKTRQILSETITINPTKVTSDNYSEYLEQKDEYKEKIASTDFEQGYKDYLSSSGCSSSEELEAVHSVGLTKMDDFKAFLSADMSQALGLLEEKGSNLFTADTINNIIKGSKPSDLVDYLHTPSNNIEEYVDNFQTLLSKVDPEKSGLGQDYLDNLSSALDSALKEFEASHKQNGDAALDAINSSTSTSSATKNSTNQSTESDSTTNSISQSNTSDVADSSTTPNTLSFQDAYQRKMALQAYAS